MGASETVTEGEACEEEKKSPNMGRGKGSNRGRTHRDILFQTGKRRKPRGRTRRFNSREKTN